MLIMPRIHHRRIERLKSNRSIRLQGVERTKPRQQHQPPEINERRMVQERRKSNIPVKRDRRRNDRRNAHRHLRPEIRSLLENAGNNNPATLRRGGVYINEDV